MRKRKVPGNGKDAAVHGAEAGQGHKQRDHDGEVPHHPTCKFLEVIKMILTCINAYVIIKGVNE